MYCHYNCMARLAHPCVSVNVKRQGGWGFEMSRTVMSASYFKEICLKDWEY